MFLLVPAKFLHRGSCCRIQLPIPRNSTRERLVALLDRFCSADESGLQFTPNRATHECLGTIVAHVPERVQLLENEPGPNRSVFCCVIHPPVLQQIDIHQLSLQGKRRLPDRLSQGSK